MKVVVQKRTKFTMIEQITARDETISLRALGLLIYMLSFDDNWKFTIDFLVQHRKEGRDAIRTTLQELVEHGYLKVDKVLDEKKRFAGYQYTIYECSDPDYIYNSML